MHIHIQAHMRAHTYTHTTQTPLILGHFSYQKGAVEAAVIAIKGQNIRKSG